MTSTAPEGDAHHVAPLVGRVPADALLREVRAVVVARPGARLVAEREGGFDAEETTAWFGFVDELSFRRRPGGGSVVDVRSLSRVGWWDLGTNRRRVEAIRAALERADHPGPAR